MKAKFLEKGWLTMTEGKIYDVKPDHDDADMYLVTDDEGSETCFLKTRFKLFSTLEEKSAEIQETEARLAVLKEELADLQTPKVGQKYLHASGDKYILTQIEGKFCLICYSVEDGNEDYIGRGYSCLEGKANDAFLGSSKALTLIKE